MWDEEDHLRRPTTGPRLTLTSGRQVQEVKEAKVTRKFPKPQENYQEGGVMDVKVSRRQVSPHY